MVQGGAAGRHSPSVSRHSTKFSTIEQGKESAIFNRYRSAFERKLVCSAELSGKFYIEAMTLFRPEGSVTIQRKAMNGQS